MALNYDTGREPRNLSDIVALIEAVRNADGAEDETHAIEWKSEVDLTKKSGQFVAARAILGFANRMVGTSRRDFEGAAYLLIGVEPGNLAGSPPVDEATLEPQLRRFVDGPAWSSRNVRVDGRNIVVITVSPPRDGDPIHTLQQDFSETRDRSGQSGDVYIRRGTGIHRANAREMKQLTDRMLASTMAPEIDVDLRFDPDAAGVRVVDVSDLALNEVVDEERTKRLEQTRIRASPSLGVFANDPRSVQGYTREVDAYIAKLKACVSKVLVNLLADLVFEVHPFKIEVSNQSDETLVDVRVTFSTPASIEQHFRPPSIDAPRPPEPLGASSILGLGSMQSIPAFPSLAWMNAPVPEVRSGRRITSLSLGDLHPGAYADTDPVALVAGQREPFDDDDLFLEVAVTASNRRSKFTQSIALQRSEVLPAVRVFQLLAR